MSYSNLITQSIQMHNVLKWLQVIMHYVPCHSEVIMVQASCPRSVLIMFQTHLKESVATFSFNLTSNIEKLADSHSLQRARVSLKPRALCVRADPCACLSHPGSVSPSGGRSRAEGSLHRWAPLSAGAARSADKHRGVRRSGCRRRGHGGRMCLRRCHTQ